MDKNFCIIVFSHADTPEKRGMLDDSLFTLKKAGIPIILVSHLSVSEKAQNLCEYFIKDNNNLIATEAHIYENPVPLDLPLFSVEDFYAGCVFRTSQFKKTYIPGCINLYISSFHFAKNIGFKNCILWEFDYQPGPKTLDFLVDSSQKFISLDLKYLTFVSYIQGLESLHAIPAFFNLEIVTRFLPTEHICDPNDFSKITGMRIIEQWMGHHVWKEKEGQKLDYSLIPELMPDLVTGKINTHSTGWSFFGLRSGLYFREGSGDVVFAGRNDSPAKLNTSLSVYSNVSGELLWSSSRDLDPGWWFIDYLPQEIPTLFQNEPGVRVTEKVLDLDLGTDDEFSYYISRKNLDYVSRFKNFRIV
jgi:hypothetical protein